MGSLTEQEVAEQNQLLQVYSKIPYMSGEFLVLRNNGSGKILNKYHEKVNAFNNLFEIIGYLIRAIEFTKRPKLG